MNNADLLRLALMLSKRAESYDAKHLANSFVEIGNVSTLLRNNDSAIIFGRRGTGKTHLLSYLSTKLGESGGVVVNVDMRTIGSSSGLYADAGIDLSERATRLLRDTANSIHEQILEKYTNPDTGVYGEGIVQGLDTFLDAANSLSIDGAITREQAQQTEAGAAVSTQLGGAVSNASMSFSFNETAKVSEAEKRVITGKPSLRINFAGLTSALERVVANLPKKKLWVLLDEWSEVPLDLQPYLADMLRRGFLAVRGVTAKIAAIEHRTNFRFINESAGTSVGIEVGADVALSVNLDDYMVFENDSRASSDFFAQMLFRHMRSLANDEKIIFDLEGSASLIKQMFTQRDVFAELVRASEGVPRDAINILSKCALKAGSGNISMPIVRDAARTWYATSKQTDVANRPRASELLDWIKGEVIGNRKARGFLLDVKVKDPLIDFLFDSRVLHIIKKNISSQDRDESGRKFNAWVLDYGCYIELMNTASAPKGIYEAEENEANSRTRYVDVPHTDYRSLRRAILELSDFYGAKKFIH